MISPMDLIRFFTPLQEAFDELADSLALLPRQMLKGIPEYRSNLDQSRSEMRTDNFIVLLLIVPV